MVTQNFSREIQVSAGRVPNMPSCSVAVLDLRKFRFSQHSLRNKGARRVWHPSCRNLNFSRTVTGITKWFCFTIEGYLSYLLPKFENLVSTILGSGAIWKVSQIIMITQYMMRDWGSLNRVPRGFYQVLRLAGWNVPSQCTFSGTSRKLGKTFLRVFLHEVGSTVVSGD